MRVLAVDYGTKRIGVAVSDALGISARGVTTLEGFKPEAAVARLVELMGELGVEAVVVGLPVREDGSVGDAARRVLGFVERLRDAVDLPIHTVNEWLTSVEAEERMKELGMSQRRRRERIDEAAAIVMLEEYLAGLERNEGESRDNG